MLCRPFPEEYSALSAFAESMRFEDLLEVVFSRGLAMQLVIEREDQGRTNLSMVAANPNPTRVGKFFTKWALRNLVEMIATTTNALTAGDCQLQFGRRTDSLSVVSRSVSEAQQLASPTTLQRGTVTIPLQGIDVPFHLAYLRDGVPSYRSFLEERIRDGDVDPQRLIGKLVPNVMGKPFSLSLEYIQDAYRLTASPILGEVLAA
ncbi:fatty acid synthase subunit beta [Penicillium longicatenatum]|uniref:fatty acid synthase subunit beta n=1 Tax=Penicillium longicatenatum TaxID=1561947 RepID=UPI00254873D8|nr:fatty acid synthase subunit beta [Penicillium longicatenatum]KAJ5660999.1 fatty acid synthase subunit beta [Penicillium longicatenatum]